MTAYFNLVSCMLFLQYCVYTFHSLCKLCLLAVRLPVQNADKCLKLFTLAHVGIFIVISQEAFLLSVAKCPQRCI